MKLIERCPCGATIKLDALPAVVVAIMGEWRAGHTDHAPPTPGRCGVAGVRIESLERSETPVCELRAGHAGWHKDGVTEWGQIVFEGTPR